MIFANTINNSGEEDSELMVKETQDMADIFDWVMKKNKVERVKNWIYSKTFWVRCIKYGHQRIHRGYSDMDMWDIDKWFYHVVVPMLESYRRTCQGIPNKIAGKYCDEEGNFDEASACVAWDKELRKMIWLFRESDSETSKGGLNKGEEYMEKCKDKAFIMFSRYFHDLWD